MKIHNLEMGCRDLIVNFITVGKWRFTNSTGNANNPKWNSYDFEIHWNYSMACL